MSATSIDQLLDLYERHGATRYDEELSQLAHAEQTAALARAAGSSDELVAAALLHDVGHLLEVADAGDRDRTADLRHEARGAAWLSGLLPPAVTAPIALHVRAKRYLCTVEPSYTAILSPGSVASLERQGGPLAPADVAAFEGNPGWDEATRLRRWDDQAKVLDLVVDPLESYRPLLTAICGRIAPDGGGMRPQNG
jgi:[1-hydroxy-2-(trimethylamino)ethyl]phosphonate dioxygenase